MSGWAYLSSLQQAVEAPWQLQPLVLAQLQSQREKHQRSKQNPHKQQHHQTVEEEKQWAVQVMRPVVYPPPVTSASPPPRSRAHRERATAPLCTGWQTWPHRKPRMIPRVSRKEQMLSHCTMSANSIRELKVHHCLLSLFSQNLVHFAP